ncbi:MAG TPA: class I SAM-dependent methyltransferase [Terriglobia bacterium]|nr:class I SAM-dependent methyltransferase [Terriglobia bacterium]
MNYGRIYQHRFKGIDKVAKQAVWTEISLWIYERMGRPQSVLDPAAGEMEFLKSIPAKNKWGVDAQEPAELVRSVISQEGIRFIHGDIFGVDLPSDYFDAIFISNFLEHLRSPEEIDALLTTMYRCLRKDGILAIMGPNFKYCSADYFDCADHRLALTHVSIEEFLFATEFRIETIFPRFLPYSFRSRLPASPALVKLYLNFPILWKLLGKQFLIFARK